MIEWNVCLGMGFVGCELRIFGNMIFIVALLKSFRRNGIGFSKASANEMVTQFVNICLLRRSRLHGPRQ